MARGETQHNRDAAGHHGEAAPTPHARHALPPLSADLPRHPWGAGGSWPARQPVLPWRPWSPRGCHHLHGEVHPGGVVRHALCGERRPCSAPGGGTRQCRGAADPQPRHPVTIKHLVQLLLDEPLDLVVIHHVSLGGHAIGHHHQAPWGIVVPRPPGSVAAPPYHHPGGARQPGAACGAGGARGTPLSRRPPWPDEAHGTAFPRPPGHAGSALLPGVAPLAGGSSFALWRHREAGLSAQQGCGVPERPRRRSRALPSPSGQPVPWCRVFLGVPGETRRSRVAGMSPTGAPCQHHGQARGCHDLAPGPSGQRSCKAHACTSFPTGPSGPCSPWETKAGQREVVAGAVLSSRSPLHHGEGLCATPRAPRHSPAVPGGPGVPAVLASPAALARPWSPARPSAPAGRQEGARSIRGSSGWGQ